MLLAMECCLALLGRSASMGLWEADIVQPGGGSSPPNPGPRFSFKQTYLWPERPSVSSIL